MSSEAEDNAKSVEVGTHEGGYQSNLSRETKLHASGKILKKCDITLRSVKYHTT